MAIGDYRNTPATFARTVGFTALGLIMLLAGCGGGGSSNGSSNADDPQAEPPPVAQIETQGGIQKGPFIIGSTISVNVLTAEAEATSATITTETRDDFGTFAFSADEGALVRISANGFYRNELTGQVSGEITLRGVHSVAEGTSAYINVLTHLTSDRIVELISSAGLTFEAARDQAETEFLLAFSEVVQNSGEFPFVSLSIYDTPDARSSAYLLAVSAILLERASELAEENASDADAELSLLLNSLVADFAEDGTIETPLDGLRTAIPNLRPDQISANTAALVADNPDFVPADINEFLDTDLDGEFNAVDTDDDNDLIPDDVDTSPYERDLVASSQALAVDEDTSLLVDVSTNASDQLPVALLITRAPSNGTVNGAYPTLTYTPDENYAGVDSFSYQVSQGELASDIASISITVNPINDAPVISGNPPQETLTDALFSFTPSVLNVEADNLTFSIENAPAWAAFDPATGTLEGTPIRSESGTTDDIRIRVSDGQASADLAPFSLTVAKAPWFSGPELPAVRQSPAVAGTNDAIYVHGGFVEGPGALERSTLMDRFDPSTNTWTSLSPSPEVQINHTAHVVGDMFYAFGGGESGNRAIDSVYAYSIPEDEWSQRESMSVARENHASCLFGNEVYVFGGRNPDGTLGSVESYNPETNAWTPRADMPAPAWGVSCATLGELIYVFGGATDERAINVYDPSLDAWSSAGALSSAKRYGVNVVVYQDQAYLLGGYQCTEGCGPLATADVFDPANGGQLTARASIPRETTGGGAAVIGDLIYLLAADNRNNQQLVLLRIYEPGVDD
ncbi:MAG: kelch repeat-containing protein [Pseudomonadota bacterium]